MSVCGVFIQKKQVFSMKYFVEQRSPHTVRNKAYSNSFIKLSLRFWYIYGYLNHLFAGRYGDHLYRDG